MLWLLAASALGRRPLRSFLTALGIAVAVGSMVIFLSLGEGLRQVFVSEISSIGPDIQVSFGPFDAAASLSAVPELPLGYVERLDGVAGRYGLTRVTPLLLVVRGALIPSRAAVYQGIPPGVEVGSLFGGFAVEAGRALAAGDAGRPVAVVGRQAAQRLGVGLGDPLAFNPGTRFEVVGIASSSGGLVDNAVLVPLDTLQAAAGVRDRVTFLALDLTEPGRARETAEALAEAFPELGFQTRGDVLQVLEQGIRVSDAVRLGISAIALIVGAIAVANTMLMSVFERTKEFGVVRAVGARPRFLFGLVLLEGLLLSLVGALAGMGLGQLGVVAVNRFARGLVGLDVAALTPRLALFAAAVALAIGLLAGLAPAARAARIPIASAVARE